MDKIEVLKSIVKEDLRSICLIPELTKFKADATAQGAAYYARYLEDERHEKISQVPRRWIVSESADVKRVERKLGTEGSRKRDMGADELKDHEKLA